MKPLEGYQESKTDKKVSEILKLVKEIERMLKKIETDNAIGRMVGRSY